MKIAFWTASHLPDLGGFQWSTFRLARSLQQLGCKLTFVTKESGQPEYPSNIPTVRFGGKTVYDWAIESGQWLIKNHHCFDLVHVIDLFYKAIDLQLEILKQIGLPIVMKIPTAGCIPRLINNKKRKFGFCGINAFSALSGDIKSELLQVGVDRGNIYLIPNGIDTEEFQPPSEKVTVRKKIGLPDDKILLLFAGRFVSRKRLNILLSAMKLLPHNILLILVGSGFGQRDSVEEDIKKQISVLRNVVVYNPTPHILAYYQACDINVLLSEREGMPNSILEGMSCMLPTVATNISGINNIITSGKEGLLVPVGDVLKTVSALKYLAGNIKSRELMGKNARQKILSQFEINFIANQYLELYRKILRRKE